MPPQFGYDPIATVQQAITSLLTTHEPQFLGIGLRMYTSARVHRLEGPVRAATTRPAVC